MTDAKATTELVHLKLLCRKAYRLRLEIDAMNRDERYAGGYAIAAASEEYRLTILAIENEGSKS